MKTFIKALHVMIPILVWSAMMAQSPSTPRVIAEFPGVCLKWIHAAEPEFQREQLNLERYTVLVFEEKESVSVILRSRDAVPEVRGSSGTYPGYEVEISKKDMSVSRSNYVR